MRFLDNGIFEEDYRISFTHVGPDDLLTNKSFLLLMENLAEAHSEAVHMTFRDLAKNNMTWILLNWKLQVFKRPKSDTMVKLQTWPVFANKIFIIRDFKMFDAEGNLCAIASSKWCLLNTSINKIARMPDNIDSIFHGFKIPYVFGGNDLAKLSVPDSEAIDSDYYKIRRFDLDINNHVHNLNYLNYAYEILPVNVYKGPELNNVEIYYKREIKYGETIHSTLYVESGIYTIVTEDENEEIVHSIIKLY